MGSACRIRIRPMKPGTCSWVDLPKSTWPGPPGPGRRMPGPAMLSMLRLRRILGLTPGRARAKSSERPARSSTMCEQMSNLEALRDGIVGQGLLTGWWETIGARIAEADLGRVVVELDVRAGQLDSGGV